HFRYRYDDHRDLHSFPTRRSSDLDPSLKVNLLLKDGQEVKGGDIGLTVEGKAASILTTERLLLNCMQRMSGIATKTHQYNQLIRDRKSTRLNSSHVKISYAVFCLK